MANAAVAPAGTAPTTLWAWAGGRGDVVAILRAGGDERQRSIDRDATSVTGPMMTAVAVVGGVVELARTGGAGVFGLFCAVAGVTYAFSLFMVLRRR